MELCAPRSESHDCPVIVGFGANRRPLKRASAGHGIGTKHLGTGDIEQEDLAREPVREIRGKRNLRWSRRVKLRTHHRTSC